DNVTLSCNYSTTNFGDAIQWYRQFPKSRPEFLLYIYIQGTKSDPLPPRMSAEMDKDNKRVDLLISSALTDSALYYCALRAVQKLISSLHHDISEPQTQIKTPLTPGEPVTLKCSFETSNQHIMLYWYRQSPNRALQYVSYKGARQQSSYADTSDDRFSSTASSSSTELRVRELRLVDSALHYCALRDFGAQ
uniref:Ig-like domain-containing protein n=1 Tax=Pygocentrus nattereri TaxID=42514 RepID=A0AAR2LBA6_PYGNA